MKKLICPDDKILVAGHRGMVGSGIVRQLEKSGYGNLAVRGREEVDLRNLNDVERFFEEEKPDVVVLAAARVGGIQANIAHPAEFLFENLAIQNNVIDTSYRNGVKRFCFLGSSCIYPAQCVQPMKEEYLLTGPLEPTNEAYALAKIAGVRMTEYYRRQYGFDGISLIPCNLYGANDSFDPQNSHVLSALVRKFVAAAAEGAESVTVWGTGIARREFMHVDDCARAVVFMLENYACGQIVNVGCGKDVSIRELAEMIACQTGFAGTIEWDSSKPDGMLRKCMDVTRMRDLGFMPEIALREGIKQTIDEYRQMQSSGGQHR